MKTSTHYYSVRIPWSDCATQWHPATKTGPFSVLVRGVFETKALARAWAKEHLQGQPYGLIRYER